MDMVLGKVSSLFSVSYVVGAHWIASMRQFQCVPTIYVFSINEFFTISFFKTNSQPLSFFQRNEHEEMNNFSCSLSCTWVTVLCIRQLLLRCFMGVYC